MTSFIAEPLRSALERGVDGTTRLWVVVSTIWPDGVQEVLRWRGSHAPACGVHLLLSDEAAPGTHSERNQALRIALENGWACRGLQAPRSFKASLLIFESTRGATLMAIPVEARPLGDQYQLVAGLQTTDTSNAEVIRATLDFVRARWKEATPISLNAALVSSDSTPTALVAGTNPEPDECVDAPGRQVTDGVVDYFTLLRHRIADEVLAKAELIHMVTHRRNLKYTMHPQALRLPKDRVEIFGPFSYSQKSRVSVELFDPKLRKRLEGLVTYRQENLRIRSVTTDFGRLLPLTARDEWMKADATLEVESNRAKADLPATDREQVENRLKDGLRSLWRRVHKDEKGLTDALLRELVAAHWKRIQKRPPAVSVTVDIRQTTEYQTFLRDPNTEPDPRVHAHREQVILHLLTAWAKSVRQALVNSEQERTRWLDGYGDPLVRLANQLREREAQRLHRRNSRFPTWTDLYETAERQMERMEAWSSMSLDTVLNEFAAWCLPRGLFDLAVMARQEAEGYQKWDDHLCCMTCSVALAAGLEQCGYRPRVVIGRVNLDRRHPAFGYEIVHHWVEVDGLWLDMTADQFHNYLERPTESIRVIPAGSDDRYTLEGDADPDMIEEMRRDEPLVGRLIAVLAHLGRAVKPV